MTSITSIKEYTTTDLVLQFDLQTFNSVKLLCIRISVTQFINHLTVTMFSNYLDGVNSIKYWLTLYVHVSFKRLNHLDYSKCVKTAVIQTFTNK